jgi:hypothetical protein
VTGFHENGFKDQRLVATFSVFICNTKAAMQTSPVGVILEPLDNRVLKCLVVIEI